jgi:hypothetical protein
MKGFFGYLMFQHSWLAFAIWVIVVIVCAKIVIILNRKSEEWEHDRILTESSETEIKPIPETTENRMKRVKAELAILTKP